MDKKISSRQLERYPMYLNHLITLHNSGIINTSAPKIAKALDLKTEQVRKDLQDVSSDFGKPKAGRDVALLINDLQNFLGYNQLDRAIVVGVGHLGQAFMNFDGFKEYGLEIVEGYDVNPKIVGQKEGNKPVYHVDSLQESIKGKDIKVAILTTPIEVANETACLLAKAGIKGIWNFTGAFLSYEGVVIENMNLASSLAKLSHRINNKTSKK